MAPTELDQHMNQVLKTVKQCKEEEGRAERRGLPVT